MKFAYHQIKEDYCYHNRSVSRILTSSGEQLRTAANVDDVIYYKDLSIKSKDGSCTAAVFASWVRRMNRNRM